MLRNVVVLHDGPLVTPEMLPLEMTLTHGATAPLAVVEALPGGASRSAGAADRIAPLVGTPLAEVERELIEATIEYCGGSIPRAAKILELSPSTIYRKIESWSAGQRRAGA